MLVYLTWLSNLCFDESCWRENDEQTFKEDTLSPEEIKECLAFDQEKAGQLKGKISQIRWLVPNNSEGYYLIIIEGDEAAIKAEQAYIFGVVQHASEIIKVKLGHEHVFHSDERTAITKKLWIKRLLQYITKKQIFEYYSDNYFLRIDPVNIDLSAEDIKRIKYSKVPLTSYYNNQGTVLIEPFLKAQSYKYKRCLLQCARLNESGVNFYKYTTPIIFIILITILGLASYILSDAKFNHIPNDLQALSLHSKLLGMLLLSLAISQYVIAIQIEKSLVLCNQTVGFMEVMKLSIVKDSSTKAGSQYFLNMFNASINTIKAYRENIADRLTMRRYKSAAYSTILLFYKLIVT